MEHKTKKRSEPSAIWYSIWVSKINIVLCKGICKTCTTNKQEEEKCATAKVKMLYQLFSTVHISRVTEAAFHTDFRAHLWLRTTAGWTGWTTHLVVAVGWTCNSWRHNNSSEVNRRTDRERGRCYVDAQSLEEVCWYLKEPKWATVKGKCLWLEDFWGFF